MTDSGWQLDINQLTIFNMIVHTMNSKELLKEIFNDYKIVERKANYLGLSLRREAVKSKEKHVHRIFDYRSKQHNNWIINVDYYIARPSFSAIVYYLDQYGLNGIRVNASLKSLTHFTPHFLDRYNQRFLQQEKLSKIELLKLFICNNPIEVILSVTDIDSNQNRIFGRFKEGTGLGYEEIFDDIGKVIRHFKTFISNDMIKESQQDVSSYVGRLYNKYWDEIFKKSRRRA